MPLRNPFYKRYVKFTLLAFFMVAFLPIASASIWDVDTEQKIVRSYNVADSAVPCNYVPNELTLTASKDNTLYESASGALSNGKGEYIFAGSTNLTEVGVRRALIAFDLSNQLLSSATIISASLELNMSKSLISESEVGLHRVLANWGEGQSDAENEEGAGAEATIGDATCTGAVESVAADIDAVIQEVASARQTERGTRSDDKRSETAMEDRKKEGYF